MTEQLFLHTHRNLNIPQFYQYLQESAKQNLKHTFLVVFYIRDCRGGLGERNLGRRGLVWLFLNYPDQFMNTLPLISEYGRWDDYFQLFPTVLRLQSEKFIKRNYLTLEKINLEKIKKAQMEIVYFIARTLREDRMKMLKNEPCSMLSKWVPSENSSMDKEYGVYSTLCTALRRTPKYMRKYYISPLRKYLQVTERYMCENRWKDIDYTLVPRGAWRKYDYALKLHDEIKYKLWKPYTVKKDWLVVVDEGIENDFITTLVTISNGNDGKKIYVTNSIRGEEEGKMVFTWNVGDNSLYLNGRFILKGEPERIFYILLHERELLLENILSRERYKNILKIL